MEWYVELLKRSRMESLYSSPPPKFSTLCVCVCVCVVTEAQNSMCSSNFISLVCRTQ
jgi:hypothetical protein